MDVNSLSHTKWNCKYHIVFAPKFRRKVAYGQLKQDIANILSFRFLEASKSCLALRLLVLFEKNLWL